MKKKLLIGLSVVALVALLAVGTWAWFTATAEPVTNTFKAGTVEIVLHDEFAEGGITNWNPGDCTDKVVYVENTGSKKAYVRVKLTAGWYDEVGEELLNLSTNNVTYDIGEDWWLGEDGWYYYKGVLEAENTTSKLIETVCLGGAVTGNEYQGKTFKLEVKAEAVQASNDAYKDVWSLTKLPWDEEF
ncbi:MAG: hypothetical protein GYA86_10260 [Firmicutes bacterium]|nr:hypothetical protein [Bacillota bacterium]